MKRRTFLLSGIAGVAGLALAGNWWANRNVVQASSAVILAQLQALRGRALRSSGQWSAFQIFSHLAQSIEYSLSGYPETKPQWFQQTAGSAAFTAFAAAGAMRHSLTEPIPGAPALLDDSDNDAALMRLLNALQNFEAHQGALAPHFAYGEMTKPQYRMAHLLHIQNHLSEIQG